MRKFLIVLSAAGIGLVLAVKVSLAAEFPQPTGYVNDFANVISDPVENALEKRLSSFTASTSHELSVVTLISLEGDVVENVAVDIFKQWGIGTKKNDNGTLLLIAVEDRELKIEVGYGLEPILTDSRAGMIIRNEITPAFKQGDYDGGVNKGVDAIIEVLTGDPTAFDLREESVSEVSSVIGFLPFAMMVFFIYAIAFLSRSKRFWPGGVIGVVGGFLLGMTATIFLAIFMALFFGFFGLVMDFVLSRNYKKRKGKGLPTSWWSSGGGFSSGGSSFGGFSGGSSGGGGASGSW